ncbi:hypothetical protein SDC9_163932 [bioreactor metagenome]|uniref:Uncharacterized protein n=1 Tax=bioreactor metagenome TaxID=1076179 RepID=A0A645FQ83_9ZZZZ
MQAQASPGIGAGAGRSAQHQHLADALFQLLDALRYGRGCDVQLARRALKTALAHDGRKGLKACVIKHLVFLNML